MSGYCQDRAIMWLSRSFTAASGELREAYVELAFIYEQMGLLTDRLEQLSERLSERPPA
ncbi:hypothetical protein D3C77_208310 [compost metagenome]|jgi:hypothetical protein